MLVFDNAQNPQEISSFVPRSGAHVLITSQWSDWAEWAVEVPVDVFDRSSAVRLLLERSQRGSSESETAERLAEELGDLPLALNHAAAYCRATNLSFEEYRKEISKYIARAPHSSRYSQSVYSTFSIALERAADDSAETFVIVSVLGVLSPERIPWEIIEMIPDGAVSKAAVRETIARLSTLSLVDLVRWDNRSEISIHRLVQQAIRLRLKTEGSEDQGVAIATAMLAKAFPSRYRGEEDNDPFNPKTWPTCMRLLPHALSVLETPSQLPIAAEATSFLMHHVGRYLYARGQHASAETQLRRGLDLKESVVGPDHISLLPDLRSLGRLLLDRARPTEAEPLLRRSLALAERELGPDHPDVGTELNNLASVLEHREEFHEAESHYRRAIMLAEKGYGAEDQRVKTRLNNLALLLQKTGRGADAEAIYRSIGESGEQGNLGVLLRDTGRLSESEGLLRQALASHEAQFGPEHPEVARDLSNLATLFMETERYEEAEPLLRRAIAIEEATIGPDHPRVAIRLSNLATLLAKIGKTDEAVRVSLRAVEIQDNRNTGDRDERSTESMYDNMANIMMPKLLEMWGLKDLGLDVVVRTNPQRAAEEMAANLKAFEESLHAGSAEDEASSEMDELADEPETPLQIAASNGDEARLHALLSGDIDIDEGTEDGYTALHFSAREGHEVATRLLIQAGASVDSLTSENHTPLHLASGNNRAGVVQQLINSGADIEARTLEGTTSLHIAALANQLDVVMTLLAAGADINARDNDAWTPLHFAAANDSCESLKALVDAGASLLAEADEPYKTYTPLHLAAKIGNTSVALALIEAGVDLDLKIGSGHGPLHLASEAGHVQLVEELIAAGAQVNLRTNQGSTPMHFGAVNGHREVVELLLNSGADKTARTKDGYAPLDLAANRRHKTIVGMLVSGDPKEISAPVTKEEPAAVPEPTSDAGEGQLAARLDSPEHAAPGREPAATTEVASDGAASVRQQGAGEYAREAKRANASRPYTWFALVLLALGVLLAAAGIRMGAGWP